MSNVFISVFGVNQDIVYKYHLKIAQIGPENFIHKIHKSHGGIVRSKGIMVNS